MSQLARVSAHPLPPPAPVDVDRAIARYVDVTFERLRRALLDSATTLVEPSTSSPDRARARATLLVETLAGFAIGSTVGLVASAAKRSMPRSRDAIETAIRSERPRVQISAVAPGPWLSPDGAEAKPLLERLVSQLHVRLSLGVAQARALLAAIADACDDRARFAAALDALAGDATTAMAFADQLEVGWRFFTAVTAGARDPVIDDGPRWRRARDLWPAWSRRVRGVIEIDCSYILRIN